MRRMVLDKSCDTFTPEEADTKYIYAGVDNSGSVCIATTGSYKDEEDYSMRFLGLGVNCYENDGFTTGNGYCYGGSETLVSVLRKFSAQGTDVYEFHTTLEFLEWALEQEVKRGR